jgi:hypothetical protein
MSELDIKQIDNVRPLTVANSYRVTVRAKYICPTNHRGSRISVARFENSIFGRDPFRVVVSWDYSLDLADNYRAAIRHYLTGANWGGEWVVSMVTDGAVAVCLDVLR